MKRYVLKLLVLCCGTAAATTGNHTTLLYVKDHVGSVRTVIDRNGTVVEAKGYYPFGTGMEGKSSQTSATPVPEGFSGQQLDEVEGNVGVKRLSLLNYGARLLDTRLMRWMGRDPLEHESFGINPYQFARNNPLMWIDVGGLECVAPSTGCSYAENLGIMTAVMCDEENTGDCRTVSEELWTCGTDMFGDYLWVKMRESTWSNCPTSGDNLMYAGSDFALIEASVGGKLVYSTEAGWADGYGSYLVADLIGDPFNLANPFNIDYSRMTYAYTNRNGVTTTWGAKYNYPGVRAPERGTEGEFKGNTLAWGTTTFLMGTAGAVTSGIFLYSGGASNQVSAYRLKASMVTGMNMMAWGIADMVGAFYGKEPTIVNLLPSTPKTQEEANVEAAKILFGP